MVVNVNYIWTLHTLRFIYNNDDDFHAVVVVVVVDVDSYIHIGTITDNFVFLAISLNLFFLIFLFGCLVDCFCLFHRKKIAN